MGRNRLAKRFALLAASLSCLAADPPPQPELPQRIWYVDAGDTALDYRIAASAAACPSEDDFRERTADLYDFDDPFVPPGIRAHTLIRIDVAKTTVGYRGIIFVIDPATGEILRQSAEEEQTRCDTLVWILSHRMRLILSPKPHAPAPAARPTKDPETEKRLDALEEAAEDQDETNKELRAKIAALQRALAEEKKRKMDLTYALSAGAFITANLTSNVGPGLWVGGELRAGPLALGLELRSVLPSRVEIGPYDYDLSQYVALLTPCGRYSYFFGCGIAGAGAQLQYDANFPGGSQSRVDPLIHLGGRVGVEVPFGGDDVTLAGRAWGEVLYSTPPTRITYQGTGFSYDWDRPDVSAFFGIGIVVRFGKEGT